MKMGSEVQGSRVQGSGFKGSGFKGSGFRVQRFINMNRYLASFELRRHENRTI